MKVGTENIKHEILRALKRHGAILKGIKYGDFADELTDKICDMFGGEMDNFWNEAHGFPTELEDTVRKLERGLNITLLRKEYLVEAYQWIKEQDESGKPIKQFIKWATGPEQAKFVGKYRANPGLIKLDYQYAFETKEKNNPQNIQVGF